MCDDGEDHGNDFGCVDDDIDNADESGDNSGNNVGGNEDSSDIMRMITMTMMIVAIMRMLHNYTRLVPSLFDVTEATYNCHPLTIFLNKYVVMVH